MGITLNRNAIPFDPRSPFVTSGVRIGTPAATTAGMKEDQMITLGRVIVEILRSRADDLAMKRHRETVVDLVEEFPAYPAEFRGYV